MVERVRGCGERVEEDGTEFAAKVLVVRARTRENRACKVDVVVVVDLRWVLDTT